MNKDYKVVVDAGHGGEDPGAVGNGIKEKDLTLEASNYMTKRLKELGIPVVQIRTTDETISPTERVNRILNAFGNNPNVIVVSNHINAGGGDGAEVIYALRNSDALAKKVLEEIGRSGQNTRKYYQRRLPENTDKDYYFIHRNTGSTQPILIEYGFIDSKKDDVSQLKNNLTNLVEGAVRAIADYTNTPYVAVSDEYYVVEAKDTLWNIAKKFNTTVDEIKKSNNLTSNTLSIGQVLKIPKENSQTPSNKDTYIVQKGDTLYQIANKYNTTVDNIKEYNNLVTNTLSIGQVLKIPKNNKTYTVVKGDIIFMGNNEYYWH